MADPVDPTKGAPPPVAPPDDPTASTTLDDPDTPATGPVPPRDEYVDGDPPRAPDLGHPSPKHPLFPARGQKTVFELKGEFTLSDPPTENEILAIVGAIVEQDTAYYPNQDAGLLSGNHKKIHYRRYRIGSETISLSNMMTHVRRARGLHYTRFKSLPVAEIIKDWKTRLEASGFKVTRLARDVFPLKGKLTFSNPPIESEILHIVEAIVRQDQEFYPHQNIDLLSTNDSRFTRRWYRVGERDICLLTLAEGVRRARGITKNDYKRLSHAMVIQMWKEALRNLGFKGNEEKGDIFVLKGDLPLSDSPTEEEIINIVQAIVLQDSEYYPEQDGAFLSTDEKKFRKRWYRTGERKVSLYLLAGLFRNSRRLGRADFRALSGLKVIEEWKEALRARGIKVTERDLFPLEGDFVFSDPLT